MDTRRKNKAQDKKSNNKTEVHDSNVLSSAEVDINSIANHHLKIESKLKGIVENFINQEIKNSHSEFLNKKDLKIFVNNAEINKKEFEDSKREIENAKEEQVEKTKDNPAFFSDDTQIQKNEFIGNQITVENVPESLDKDKIFEIFFIYGDILDINLKKEEKKAFVAFKFQDSIDKALRKFDKSQRNFKSFTIRKSFEFERIRDSNKDKDLKSPEVIYIKFIDGSIIDVEEMKKILKKYGEVEKISRKIEGRSYFILFKEANVGAKIVKDFKKGLFCVKNIDFNNLIVDFACYKNEIEKKKEAEITEVHEKEAPKETEKEENEKGSTSEITKKQIPIEEQNKDDQASQKISTDNKINNIETNNNIIIENKNTQSEAEPQPQFESLDINKYWQTYFDPSYNRNYYYNPFLNESVWELPPGACAQDLQSQMEPTQINLSANLNTNSVNNLGDQNLQNVQSATNNNQTIQSYLGAKYDADENQSQGSYDDEEAWEEDELREKIIWDKLKKEQLKEWMKRPARKQVADTRRDTAYIEGNYDYNIWYDKYLTDRKEEKEKIPAMHLSNPALDTGFTKADLQEKEGGAYFCLYFAKGCCSEGVNCRYYHRVPTKEDAEKIENLRDVFGRSRFATHRSDMGGVGTFTRDCRTLYVSDLKMVDSANPIKDMIRIIYENFSPWGEIEDINYIPTKAACFIRFSHRCFAEFAKEAMMDQSLVGEEILGVKWAFDDPNPMMKKKIEKEHENRFLTAHLKRQENKNELLRKKRNNPNSDYFSYYNNRNNPYATSGNGFGYESGYGYDDSVGNAGYGYNSTEDKNQQITNNCVKLSETLRMIDENFSNPNN